MYSRQMLRRYAFACALAIITAVLVIASLRTGSYPLAFRDILAALAGCADETVSRVVFDIRLPQAAAAVLGGASLALAGAVMQNVLRNPLASPFTLGVSQGAVFGAVFAIVILGVGSNVSRGAIGADLAAWTGAAAPVLRYGLMAACAFAGSLLTVAALVALSTLRNLSPSALILAGVAISSFFGAATMLIQYFATDVQVASAVFWTFGDLKRARWAELSIMAAALIPAAAYFFLSGWSFNAMAWGDDTARSLGINAGRLRIVSLVLAAMIASVVTAFMGIIGFVGLIAPHGVRLLIGHDNRFLMPCAAMAGGIVLLVSDLIARTVMAPVVLPVGIVTSFAGAPLFLYLLLRGGGEK
ncbi:MAG: iron ABC transporter permease [Planctomycetota bacterium]|nr:iron ABC transporter permease [Planctomycetota bacterium]